MPAPEEDTRIVNRSFRRIYTDKSTLKQKQWQGTVFCVPNNFCYGESIYFMHVNYTDRNRRCKDSKTKYDV